ncbi:hypothetical protein CUMW_151740 [Citrus unshiu]|nr:hypothetical protein CUMW_151740 [Citrus unshiu]
MGKVSPKEGGAKTPKQKRRLRNSSSRYLKPGALAQQLRYNKVSTAKSCTDLGKKRVAVLDAKKLEVDELVTESKGVDETPLMLSPVDVLKQNFLVRTPKTPREEDCESESRLEALPMDLLVVIARQFYFNYTTPDRSRQEMLQIMTPRPTERWPFVSKGEGRGVLMPSPHTPKAPKHGPRPPSRMKITEMRQIAAVLFQDSTFPSRCMVPSVLPKPLCKSLASNRVLFYEDELCQAVAQNKLR